MSGRDFGVRGPRLKVRNKMRGTSFVESGALAKYFEGRSAIGRNGIRGFDLRFQPPQNRFILRRSLSRVRQTERRRAVGRHHQKRAKSRQPQRCPIVAARRFAREKMARAHKVL